jgi:hypothetical protein
MIATKEEIRAIQNIGKFSDTRALRIRHPAQLRHETSRSQRGFVTNSGLVIDKSETLAVHFEANP